MEINRMISRSIVLDPVYDRIEHLRYDQHKKSLEKISQAHPSLLTPSVSDAYISQIKKFKKSNSQVRDIFDSRLIENKTLVKKMLDIDRRKNPFRSEEKRLPTISNSKWNRYN